MRLLCSSLKVASGLKARRLGARCSYPIRV